MKAEWADAALYGYGAGEAPVTFLEGEGAGSRGRPTLQSPPPSTGKGEAPVVELIWAIAV